MTEKTEATDCIEELKHVFSHPWEMPGMGLVVSCDSYKMAAKVSLLLDELSDDDEVFHVEQYPVTQENKRAVDYYAVLIRRLSYDTNDGWFSADVSSDPDIDLRGVKPERISLL